MNIPATNEAKLARMEQIVSDVYYKRRDVSLCRELTNIAWHFSGMEKRRKRLEGHLDKLAKLTQSAAIEKQWSKINEVVGEFSHEISDASSMSAGYLHKVS